ncbi:putative alpha-ribazole phosphatase [Selenomonas ruminantium subsp. lactilytica TAM6421]|uniref:Putative alpha-ribazole phosphatase n=1 Tax=Selenomonas ruminantium subsp. lactilytica (strain NBRC 103574 / TAM6421) TaxID=927704 RepID=I0GQA0_SELRL|nr:histidine phosphatase family protein [Selenomonas ruminantium]BAL82937.1 putative alpha-ribazole phosphatase [Selenomonas ruminantium subsp. lactilytica TAM6421]
MAGEDRIKAYLLRHGEASGNVRGGYYGRTECPLTVAGRLAAMQAGEELHMALQEDPAQEILLLSSPLQRARDTAVIVQRMAGISGQIILEPAWEEIDFGTWEGRNFADIQREDPDTCQQLCDDWQNFRYPEGESFRQFTERVIAAWQKWRAYAAKRQAHLVVVSHGGVLKVIRLWEEGRSWEDFWRIRIALGEIQPLLLAVKK